MKKRTNQNRSVNKKLNIVLVINHFQPKLGYQEFFLCQEWQRLGHHVTVITSQFYFPFPHFDKTVGSILGNRQQPVGYRQERGVSTWRLKPLFFLPGGFAAWLVGLDRRLTKLKPDVVFADGIFQPLAVQVALLKKKHQFSLIYDTHAASFNTDLSGSFLKRLYMKIFRALAVPLIKKRADGFTAVGESEAQLAKNVYGLSDDEVKIILLGADTNLFKPQSAMRKRLRRELGLTEATNLMVYAGKITPEKDLEILLQAFKRVSQDCDVKLLMIGKGADDYLTKLKSFIRREHLDSKVIWKDLVDQSELAKLFSAANFGIWPGNLSNVIQEAMSCGLPVVVPAVISKHQTTHHLSLSQGVFVFKRGSAQDLAKKIKQLCHKQEQLSQYGKANRNFMMKHFAWSVLAKAHLEVYKQKHQAKQ